MMFTRMMATMLMDARARVHAQAYATARTRTCRQSIAGPPLRLAPERAGLHACARRRDRAAGSCPRNVGPAIMQGMLRAGLRARAAAVRAGGQVRAVRPDHPERDAGLSFPPRRARARALSAARARAPWRAEHVRTGKACSRAHAVQTRVKRHEPLYPSEPPSRGSPI